MITLSNIFVTFGANTVMEKKALTDLSLQIREGDFITVIGSNGAGKSTLLNTISGEILSNRGRMMIDDQDVTEKPAYARSALVSRVFQDPLMGTCGDLTIAENLALAEHRGKMRGWTPALKKTTRDKYQQIIQTLDLGLEDRLDTLISLLSGGQRQAISLLMTTLSSSKILLLDEHTSALDPKTAAFVMDLTAKIIAENNLTALMVTHSLHQALHYGTRTIMLHEGRVIYDVSGIERAGLTINDLLSKFGKTVDDDRLIFD